MARRVTRSVAASSPVREATPPPAKKARTKAPARSSPTKYTEALKTALPAPAGWRDVYETIEQQRKSIVAPVDTMGCEQGGSDTRAVPTEKDGRLSILVSLMLSSQTKDPVTHLAVKQLREQLPGGLTLEALERASVDEIDRPICKVGFHNTKAANLKKLAVRLRDDFNGDVPSDLKDLLSLSGVGPKMALLYLQAIGINAGIGVDTHVHRITNRLGWHKTQTPEQTRVNLESWLPKDLHPKINLMLVGFGQTICAPVGPRCDECMVGKRCPSFKLPKSPRKGPRVEIKLEEETVKEGVAVVEITTVKSDGERVIKSDEMVVKSEDGVPESRNSDDVNSEVVRSGHFND